MPRTQTVFPGFGRTVRHVALVALLIFAAQGAALAGVCISATIDEPIGLPGGEIHDAGTLKLCLDRDYSPVASLHLASIDNDSVGLLTSIRDTSEGQSPQPFMMFVRDDDGVLQLYGYALPHGGRMNTYLLQPPRSKTTPMTVAVDRTASTAQRLFRLGSPAQVSPAGAQ